MKDYIGSIENFIASEDFSCLAIGKNNMNDDNHIVLMYKFDNNPKVLHYKDGYITDDFSYGDLINRGYISLKMSNSLKDYFPDEDAISLFKNFCESILSLKSNILFSLKYQNQCFDIGGDLFSNIDDEFGLTCSTFILALFKSEDLGSIDLIDISKWEVNTEDEEFIDRLLEHFSGGDFPNKKQIDIIENNRACFRFRPEHVGVAFIDNSIPLGYSTCYSNGKSLNEHILNA